MIEPKIIAQIDELQVRYVCALDERNMDEWLNTFLETPETAYICTNIETIKAGHRTALMLDDCYARIQDRVAFITKVWAGTFQDYQTRHVVQRLTTKMTSEGRYQVRSSFYVTYTPEETGQTALLASGVYEDIVVIQETGPHFLSKKAIMDANVMPHYLVYPL